MEDKADIILKELHKIEDLVAAGNDERAKDIQMFQSLSLDIKTLLASGEETRKALNRNGETIKNKVIEATLPVKEATENMTTQIKKSKTVIFGEKKSWFRKLLDEVRGEVKI